MDLLTLHLENADRLIAQLQTALAGIRSDPDAHCKVGNHAHDGEMLSMDLATAFSAIFGLAEVRMGADQDAEREAIERRAEVARIITKTADVIQLPPLSRQRDWAVGSENGAA
jgi:hypothetical protein